MGVAMIFIVVKWKTKPEWSDRWLDLVAEFTAATRAEPLNLWFDWSRSVDDPTEFVLVEAFADGGAGPHVNSDHFRQAMRDMPKALVARPKIISTTIEGATDWSELGELEM
jgi:quinol monooxygenase YgiN